MKSLHIFSTIALCIAFCSNLAYTQAIKDGTVVKKVLDSSAPGANLLKPDAWNPWDKGFTRQGAIYVCDNGTDTNVQRGLGQNVYLNQKFPLPIVAQAQSRAENVGGTKDSDYSLYIDLVYTDGTTLWGQTAPFTCGTGDWETKKVIIHPDKPIRNVSMYLLLRRHSGKAYFRQPKLWQIESAPDTFMFDGTAVSGTPIRYEGFSIRDVAAGSDFTAIESKALGVKLTSTIENTKHATYYDVTITETTGRDRAVTLYYAKPLPKGSYLWLKDPRRSEPVQPRREYMYTTTFSAGANGRLSKYPFAAVASKDTARLIGIDIGTPAFYRTGYNANTNELFIAFDIGLTPEKSTAHLKFCKSEFNPEWGFRAALDQYYKIYPKYYVCRTPEQGLWMPFAHIGDVKGWEDFGFKFKEGTGHTAWDDQHDIITFRYTEPMTWWMPMPKDMPRTIEAANAHAKKLAADGNKSAQALLTSGYHNETGLFSARLLNTPWNDGAVWSINSMPGINGEVADFKNKWNSQLREKLYGPSRKGDLDGEYIDSSEGYVTDELDFNRVHFAAAQTTLTFSRDTYKVGIFRGLIAFEYIRGIAKDIHAMDKLMMANSTPHRLCFLAAHLDVMGTETNWNPSGNWRPMSDADLLYTRSVCRTKPYCFLMNTNFEQFSHALVEKYMKRSLAYGMFPGFFSHNASQGHYFTRPNLYDRDRPLFKKYVPLCKLVAEAGWEPITNAKSSEKQVYVERFGDRYLTVFNDSDKPQNATITTDFDIPSRCKDLVSQKTIDCTGNTFNLSLNAEDVAVIDLD